MFKMRLNGDFILESGEVLIRPEIAYSSYGSLNDQGDNVICISHALTANSEAHDWWSGLFGPGRLFDPERYFIICMNNIGSPYGSVSPLSTDPATGAAYGMNFPFFTMRDTAELYLDFLEELGIHRLALLIGGSCGGNIAQEMAIIRPELAEKMVLLCCSAKETPWVVAIHESQRMVLESSGDLGRVEPEKAQYLLRAARAFALPFYRSHPSFIHRQSEENEETTDDFKSSSYIRYQGEKFYKRYQVQCYYKQLKALDTHNVGRGRESIEEALRCIRSKTRVIGFSSDILIPVSEQKYLAGHIPGASYKEIDTLFGHDAFLIETERIMEVLTEDSFFEISPN